MRLLQYAAAATLLGLPLLLAGLPHRDLARWPRGWLLVSSIALASSALAGLVVQTATMAGSLSAALEPTSLGAVAAGTALGRAALVRALCGLTALALVVRARQPPWRGLVVCGLIACGSLAWMGHGAATEGNAGVAHLISDLLHACAAGVWIGALLGFLWLIGEAAGRSPDRSADLHQALAGFARLGTLAVAVLVVTGLVNSWFLVTPAGLAHLSSAVYGQLLLVKLGLFGLMVLLASANRFWLTPRLGAAIGDAAPTAVALRRLFWSLCLETALGLGVLGLVAWLGMLSPISAG